MVGIKKSVTSWDIMLAHASQCRINKIPRTLIPFFSMADWQAMSNSLRS